MKFLERDLEDIIHQADRDELYTRGLLVSGKIFRQVSIGNYGIADLITIERPDFYEKWSENDFKFKDEVRVTVYELKQHCIDVGTLLQAMNYVKGIDRYFQKSKFSKNYKLVFNIVLIGRTIQTKGSFVFLPDFIKDSKGSDFLELYTYDYKVDGIIFTSHNNYKLTNEGF